MTTITHAHLNGVTVRIRRGTTTRDSPMMLACKGDLSTVAYDPDVAPLDATSMLIRVRLRMEGYTVTEIFLEDHDPHLTALYRVCSKLHLNTERAKRPLTCTSHRPGSTSGAAGMLATVETVKT
ncbi:hypothetical protein GCM10020367_51540 [Streptomyces sannanensis]|uniref:Uncharacterized protein n=1 Tax=Streptomyces sannanensis TaxID=285536 RepID=A0ABP6SHL5_9ACTN